MSLSHYLFCLVILFSCATSQVELIKLNEHKNAFDVVCGQDINKCYENAKAKCGTQFRVHHIFDNIDLNTNMRFECIQGEKELQACGHEGVDCVLESRFI